MRGSDLGRGGRLIAACLGGVWILAGLAALGIGVWRRTAVLTTILGVVAVGYGLLWLRVAVTGERQRWPWPRSGPRGGNHR